MRNILSLLQYIIITLIALPVVAMPYPLARKVGKIIGTITFSLWKKRRDIAIGNIAHAINNRCLPESPGARTVALQSFQHLGLSIIELIKIYSKRGKKIIDSVEIDGLEHLQSAASAGKGIIVVTGHYGNWELLALAFSQKISRASVVARPQNNRYLNGLIERVRKKHGNAVIYKEGALRKIMSALRKNEVVGILYDQSVLEHEGVVTEFLRRKAWTMKIPVILAQKTGAPLLPVFLRRQDGRHVMHIFPPFIPDKTTPLDENLRRLNGFLEHQIKADPGQWLWIHRRWKRT